ncbi:TonB family protein [Phenylobacterium deserti]|nr:TonB family protein [Phenylobacterium deserti]
MRWVLALGVSAAALGVVSAFAQPSIVDPTWLRRPGPNDLRAAWPKGALEKRLEGRALIGCVVTAQGTLTQCQVLEETPAGSGFGGAALSLTPQFLMKPATQDGRPVEGGRVRIPIQFDLPSGVGAQYTKVARVITNVPWIDAPSFDDVLAAYPKGAAERGVGGRATLSCTYTPAGRLRDCRGANEQPELQGFAAAAMRLAPKFRGPPLEGDNARQPTRTEFVVAFAPETLKGVRTVGKPSWTGRPTVEQFRASYPDAAIKAGVNQARVVLRCKVEAQGRLGGCRPESEEPAGYGFGQAAASLAPTFRVSAWTAEGLPTVGSEVAAPIRYDLQALAAASAPAARP